MTCRHNKDAEKKLIELTRMLENTSSDVYEKKGPYVHPSSISSSVTGGFWSGHSSKASWSEWYTQIIDQEKLNSLLKEVENTLKSCSCAEAASSEIKNLNDQNREERKQATDERKEMLNQSAQERRHYESLIEKQTSMVEIEKRENSVVRRENVGLQQMLGLTKAQVEALERQLNVKDGQLELSNNQIEQLRRAFTDIAVENAKNSTEARLIKEQLDWTKGRVDVGDVRIENLEDKLNQKQQQIEELHQSLATLQITYQTENQTKDSELKQREKEIKFLKDKTGQVQEKFSNERENSKEGSLEEFATQLGLSLQQISSLRRYYERLVDARKNYNQDNIITHEDNISQVKQKMLNAGISMANIQKVCRKCEKLAEIRFELEGIRQQQYQIHQEQPTNY